jgi:hypothetical protein
MVPPPAAREGMLKNIYRTPSKKKPLRAPGAPDPVIAQDKRDLDAGLVDTDMRASPGLDAQRRRKLVPGAGGHLLIENQ